MKKIFLRLFCKHKNPLRLRRFFPTDVYTEKMRVDDLVITVCLDCQRIISIRDYKV